MSTSLSCHLKSANFIKFIPLSGAETLIFVGSSSGFATYWKSRSGPERGQERSQRRRRSARGLRKIWVVLRSTQKFWVLLFWWGFRWPTKKDTCYWVMRGKMEKAFKSKWVGKTVGHIWSREITKCSSTSIQTEGLFGCSKTSFKPRKLLIIKCWVLI